MRFDHFVISVALLGAASLLQAQQNPATTSFDGRWSVTLSCEDTRDQMGLVKGYEFTFDATVTNGRLEASYASPRSASRLALSGVVAADGALEIRARGSTGNVQYSVGRVAEGTRYDYTLVGKLEGDRGHAVRRELRPCSALFVRQ